MINIRTFERWAKLKYPNYKWTVSECNCNQHNQWFFVCAAVNGNYSANSVRKEYLQRKFKGLVKITIDGIALRLREVNV